MRCVKLRRHALHRQVYFTKLHTDLSSQYRFEWALLYYSQRRITVSASLILSWFHKIIDLQHAWAPEIRFIYQGSAWNGSRENPGHANLPYTSSLEIFPSSSNQSAPKLTRFTRSPAFAPEGKWGFRFSGGSTAKVKEFSCSKIAKESGAELPARVMAVIFQSFTAWVIPLLISYQLARGTRTRPKTKGKHDGLDWA